MTLKYLTFSISICFISWIVGMIINFALSKTEFYEKLSNINCIRSTKLNKFIGLSIFKWIVKNTFFKFFNPKLQLKNKATTKELIDLRQEMTFAEISHFIGFFFVMFFATLKVLRAEFIFSAWIVFMNVLMNLYPSLLQQENKRRIDHFLQRIPLKIIKKSL